MDISILDTAANILIILGSLIILLCSVSFLQSQHTLNSIHFIALANIYGFLTILIGIALKNYQSQVILKILFLIVINLLIAITLSHALNKKESQNKKNFQKSKVCKINS